MAHPRDLRKVGHSIENLVVGQPQLFGAVVGFFGAGSGAFKKRLTGANELLGLLLVNGFAMELGGIEQ